MSNDDTQSRILAAAGPVFASKGYEKATIREICAAAGVNLASVNYHFSNKETLYEETVKRAQQQRAARIPMPEFPANVPPEMKLRGVIHALFSRMISNEGESWQWKLMMREMLEPSGAFRRLAETSFRPQFERLLGIISEIAPAPLPDFKLKQIGFSIIGQCLYYRVGAEIVDALTTSEERETHFSQAALASHIADVTIAAAKAAASPELTAEENLTTLPPT